VHDLLADALAGRRTLNQDEWRLLALYSWETDQRQLVPEGNAAETVARLALACPARRRDSRDRLTLKALALSAGSPATLTVPGVGAVPKSGRTAQDASRVSALIQVAREGVGVARRVLRDPALARRHLDLLTDAPDKLVGLLAPGNLAQQRALALQWDRAMSGLAQDAGLSNLDRLSALGARVALARRDTPDATVRAALPPELIAELRAAVLRADRTATGNAERPAVISNATELLAEAGLLDESDALLKAELARSPSPYYLMLGLADNARRRHDGSAALDWYARAHAGAQGPATRLQWGASHVRALIEFAPDDAGRIESTVSGVLAEIEPVPASFEARNRNSLERLGRRIGAWGAAPEHAASLARLRAQWQAMCERVPAQTPQRAICAQAL